MNLPGYHFRSERVGSVYCIYTASQTDQKSRAFDVHLADLDIAFSKLEQVERVSIISPEMSTMFPTHFDGSQRYHGIYRLILHG